MERGVYIYLYDHPAGDKEVGGGGEAKGFQKVSQGFKDVSQGFIGGVVCDCSGRAARSKL